MFKRTVTTRMNASRAFGLIGICSQDIGNNKDENFNPKESIDKALWNQMQMLTAKKLEWIREKKEKEREKVTVGIDEGPRPTLKSRTETEGKRKATQVTKNSSTPPPPIVWPIDKTVKPGMRTTGRKPGAKRRSGKAIKPQPSIVQKPSTDESMKPIKSNYPNPYVKKDRVEYGPIEMPNQEQEQKYAEDILALHEAYQFLMRRYVIAAQGRQKLTHAMNTLSLVNKTFGASLAQKKEEGKAVTEPVTKETNGDEEDEELPPEVEGEDVEEIPCGACQMIQKLDEFNIKDEPDSKS